MIKEINYRVGDIVKVVSGDFKDSEGSIVAIYSDGVKLDLYKYPLYMGDHKDGAMGWHDWSKSGFAFMPDYLDKDEISRYKHSEVELILRTPDRRKNRSDE